MQVSDEEAKDAARLVVALREIPTMERRLAALAIVAKLAVEGSTVFDVPTKATDGASG